MMQLFVAVSTLTSLVVAAISQQHRQILFSLRNANDRLEARVEERTAALGESEARLRAFYETAPVCMGVTEPWDDDVLQIYDNPASCMIFGVEPGVTAGKWAHRDLGINPHLIRYWLGKYRASEASGLPQQFEQAVGDRDDRRWMSVTICPIGSSPEGRTRFCYVAEDITARKRTEQALTETAHSLARERERLAIALRTGRLGVYEWRVGDEAIWWSEEVYAVYGVDPDTFSPTIQSFEQLVHPDDRAELWRKSEICIEERAVFEHEYRIIAPDGQIRWIANRSQVGLGADGTVERITGVAVDVTERKIAEEQTQLLLREVNHRAKNMLGLVQAIARQTAAAGSAEFAQRFAERVQAFAASQDVLVKSGWKDVSLEELARAQLGHFGDAVGDRILLAGPELRISAAAAQAIGMALHELATNAAKYGALAIASGRIAIDWGVQGGASGAPAFYMTWIESDGPPVAVPERLGFGSTVIGTMIRMSLDCEATIDYAPSGLKWRMEADVRKLLDGASEAFARADAGPPPPGAAPLNVQASA